MGAKLDENEVVEKNVFTWMLDGHVGAARQTCTIKEVAQKGVPVEHVTQYLQQEISQSDSCKSLPFALLVVVSYAVSAITHDSSTQVVAVEKSIEMDITENANFAFSGPFIGHKNIDDVHNFADFWSWMDLGFLPLIFVQGDVLSEVKIPPEFTTTTSTMFINGSNASGMFDDNDLGGQFEVDAEGYELDEFEAGDARRGMLLHYNRIIGGVRLRQEVSKETPDCSNSIPEMDEVYGMNCFDASEVYPIQPEKRAAYSINAAPHKEEWLLTTANLTDLHEKVLDLELNDWLDNATRRVEISIPVYNAEYGLFTMVNVNFYFSLGGKIWKDIVPLSTYADWYPEPTYYVLDGIFAFCLLWITMRELWEIVQIVNAQGPKALVTDYAGFWNAVDWISVFAGAGLVAFFIINVFLSDDLREHSKDLGELNPLTEPDYQGKLRAFVQEMEDATKSCRQLRIIMAAYPVVIIMRLFKAFSAQQRLAVVTQTMWVSLVDLGHFMIVFASVFFSFAVSGVLLFGRQVRTFTRFQYAVNQGFLGLNGQFDWDDLRIVGRLEASIWYVCFEVLLTILMFNILIAIVMDAYGVVKVSTSNSDKLWEELAQEIARQRGVWRRTLVPLSSILGALKEQKNMLEKAHLERKQIRPPSETTWISAFNTEAGVTWRYFSQDPLATGLGIHDPRLADDPSFLLMEETFLPKEEALVICTGFEDERIILEDGTNEFFEVQLSEDGHIYYYRDTSRKRRDLAVFDGVVRASEEEQLKTDLVTPHILISLMSTNLWNLSRKQAHEILCMCAKNYYENHNQKKGMDHLRTIGHYLEYRIDKLYRAINGEAKASKTGPSREFADQPTHKETVSFMRQMWTIKKSIHSVFAKLKSDGLVLDGHEEEEVEPEEEALDIEELEYGDEILVVTDTRQILTSCAAAGLSMTNQEARANLAGRCGIVTDIDKRDGTVCMVFREPPSEVWLAIGSLKRKPPPDWFPPTEAAMQQRLEQQQEDEERQAKRERIVQLGEELKDLKLEMKEMTAALSRLHGNTREVTLEVDDLRQRIDQQRAAKRKTDKTAEKLKAKLSKVSRENLALERAGQKERGGTLSATDARNAYFEQIQRLMAENQEYRRLNILDMEKLDKARGVLAGGELALRARGGVPGPPTIEEARRIVEQHEANVKGGQRDLGLIIGKVDALLEVLDADSGLFLPHTQHELVKLRNMALALGPVLQDSLH